MLEDVTQHLDKEPPSPDAKTWRKGLIALSMKYKAFGSSRSVCRLPEIYIGSFVV